MIAIVAALSLLCGGCAMSKRFKIDRIHQEAAARQERAPIIFIHGLLSDPLTWADLANDLWAHPEITHRYQFWVFQYPTGKPFLESAADLRSQLAQALATLELRSAKAEFERLGSTADADMAEALLPL